MAEAALHRAPVVKVWAMADRASPAREMPAEVGVWIIVLGDMVIFSLLFGTYLFYRGEERELFAQSQRTLDPRLGAVNTLLLLTSSWLVAVAVQFARQRNGRPIPALIGASICCGLGFATIKAIEYSGKFTAGITLSTNDFFMFYFVLTGIHFLHLVLATGFLVYVWMRSRHATWLSQDIGVLEIGAIFWHLVDLLWLVLFPLLYLVH